MADAPGDGRAQVDAPRRPSSRSLRVAVAFSSVVLLLIVIVTTFAVHDVLSDARHTISLFVAAGVGAILLTPLVELLGRGMPRLVAIVVSVILLIAVSALVAWGVLGDVNQQIERLQEAAPSAAAEIEQSDRFGKIAREFRLEERVTEAVESLSQDASQQAQKAARRVATYLIGGILMLFLLSWGPRMGTAALAQISNEDTRRRVASVAVAGLHQGRAYLLFALAQSFVIGFVTWTVCRLGEVPAPAPLGLIAGLTSLVPYLGVALGAIPALLLAAGFRPVETVLLLFAVFAALQVGQVILQRRLRGSVMYVGPAIVIVVFLVGYGVYGIGGALFGIALAVFALALVEAVGVDDLEIPPVVEPSAA
jgi:putative heme transporter